MYKDKGFAIPGLAGKYLGRHWVYGLAGTVIILVLVGLLEFIGFQKTDEQKRLEATQKLNYIITSIKTQLTQHLDIARSVGAYIATHPDLNQQEYQAYSRRILGELADISHIAASRNQIIQYVYPMAGNESTLGLDIGTLPNQRQALQQARVTGKTILDGPVDLIQGKSALIARHPVYLDNNKTYWGTVSLVMHYKPLLKQALAPFEDELTVSIVSANSNDPIYGSVLSSEQKPVSATLSIQGENWQLKAIPANGWTTYNPLMVTWLSGLITIVIWWRLAYVNQHRHQMTLQHRLAQYQQARRFEQMFEQHSAIMLTIDANSGAILGANQSAQDFYGYSQTQLTQMNIAQLNTLSDRAINGYRQQANNGELNSFVFPHRIATGEVRNVEVHSSPVTIEGQTILLSIIHDVTERVEQEQKLKLDAKVFDNSQEAIMITDVAQRILAINPAFCRITGYKENEVIGQTPALLNSGRHGEEFYRDMFQCLEKSGHWRGEIWNRRKDGTIYPELLSISSVLDNEDSVSHYVAVFSDITSQKQSEEKLEQLAHYDLLTGLPNRLLLKSRMQHAIDTAHRNQSHLALLFLDLDQFKYINDSMGHAYGDVLLQEVAEVLQQRIRTSDTLARLGGDEFVVLLEELHGPEDASTVAVDLINALNKPVRLSEHKSAYIGVSIGISLFPEDASSGEELLAHADAAMYQAKSLGRNTFAYYTENITEQSQYKQRVYGELKHALERDQMELFYQPQIDLTSGHVVSAEALIRWRHPERGLLTPNHFIPVAEERGLIHDITLWVIEAACRQLVDWQSRGIDKAIAVNVSPRDFIMEQFFERVEALLAKYGVDPTLLHLELTENTLVHQPKQLIEVLRRFRTLGLHLAIDDFGTGYASLAYIRSLPVDKLKIDQSFVSDITNGKDDTTIVRAVIGLSKAFNMTVIAEGVETTAQQNILRELGCDMAQGFLYQRPVAHDTFIQWLEQWYHLTEQ